MENDARYEELQAVLPRTFLLGLFILAGIDAPTSTDCPIKVTPGVAVIDGHANQIAGEDDLDVESGTLSDGYEKWHTVVAYYNPAVNGSFLLVVSGTEATSSAAKPTDAEIETAIEAIVGSGAEYGYTVVGSVKFSRSGSTVTLDSIDNQVRSFEIPTARKDPAAAYNDVDVSDLDVYVPWGRLHLGSFDAEDIADGDLVTTLPLPAIHGRLRTLGATTTEAVSTGSKGTTLNVEIGTTNVTGSLALSGTSTLGEVASQALSGSNTFVPGDTVSLEAASTTTYAEGAFDVWLDVDRLLMSPAA